MPSHFVIDVKHELVVSIGTGIFTQADFINHMSRLRAHPLFQPEFNLLVDCRKITSMELTSEQVEDLARRTVFSGQSRCGFVVSSDLHFGLGRMFASYRETVGQGPTVEVFRKWEEALSWLHLPADLDPTLGGKPASECPIEEG